MQYVFFNSLNTHQWIECLNSRLILLPYTNLLISIPFIINNKSSWSKWNTLNTLSNNSSKLSVCLKIDLNYALIDPKFILQWDSERVKSLSIPVSLFVLNKKGYPVLHKPIQDIIIHFLKVWLHPIRFISSCDYFIKLDCSLILDVDELSSMVPLLLYHDYLSHLKATSPQPTESEKLCIDYYE